MKVQPRHALMLAAGLALLPIAGAAAPGLAIEPPPRRENRIEPMDDFLSPMERMRVEPGMPLAVRPQAPASGARTCIRVNNIAGAQLFGDTAIELSMRDGKRWRMYFANECPALSFYQGFYYRRGKAGQLCAGRDSVGARSGGECRIASIMPVK